MHTPWKKLSARSVYKSPWIEVFEEKAIRPDGQEGIYSYLSKQPGIYVIAFDGKGIYFIREYRYPVGKYILQLPGGGVSNEERESAGIRELFEETGIQAKKSRLLGEFFVAPGHETCTMAVCLATDLDTSQMGVAGQEGNENIEEVMYLTLSEVKESIRSGAIVCGLTIAALQYFFLEREGKELQD